MTSADNGKATGNGSGSRRKYLTVDRSALASARDRLYRVYSPVLTRKTDHQSSKKALQRDLYAQGTTGNANSAHLPATELRVHWCISDLNDPLYNDMERLALSGLRAGKSHFQKIAGIIRDNDASGSKHGEGRGGRV
ncbi:hypothetical protein BaRGS_00002975 [Batillaria attramentaria]|uniref:Uncharacterized protein n=1 Tax=Batillaria attramentaria TaxID=370345 RepID=A0ABD0M316_9CAEN